MAEDDMDLDDDASEDPSALVKALRKQLRDQAKELSDNKSAQRELTFIKAGINSDSPLGRLFMKSYEGELNPEAIQAEWSALNGAVAPAPPAEEIDTSAQERSSLASGAASDDHGGVDPRHEGLNRAEEMMKTGASWEDAAGSFLRGLVSAANQGDERVIVRGKSF